MKQKEPSEGASSFAFFFPELAAMGKERYEELLNAQTELLERVQETNKHWLGRIRSQANCNSEFAFKLTGAKSIPDAMTAYQDWFKREFEMMAEDGKRLVADGQTLAEAGRRLLSNGWMLNGRGGAST